ncbi:MAG TPA: M23 family metallopeptidase [Candidatus Sulfotelmatobacter sp.]|nr:M23 family metallopeptidase [Candidatus Sulfotelmatobacter sp.]
MVTFTGTLSFRLTGSRYFHPTPAVAEASGRKQPATATPKAASSAAPAEAAKSLTHTVRAGETLFAIARLHGADVDAIKQANGLSGDQIQAGQVLRIPGGKPGRRYAVQQGDSLWELAGRYGISLEDLLASNPQVDNPGHLQIGQEIILPAVGGAGDAVAATAKPVLQLGGVFSWPVFAPISSPFGPRDGRNHNGVDLAAHMGDPIKAARDGEVILAGTVSGYGETVILRHEDGTRTLYAHASRLLVRTGERVRQGEVIAEVGSTGHSTGPHLHFEIIVNNKPLDPLLYLPKSVER